jgi:hypothetical protein
MPPLAVQVQHAEGAGAGQQQEHHGGRNQLPDIGDAEEWNIACMVPPPVNGHVYRADAPWGIRACS